MTVRLVNWSMDASAWFDLMEADGRPTLFDVKRQPAHDGYHGTPGGYTNKKCRCDACRAAHATQFRNFRHNKQGGER